MSALHLTTDDAPLSTQDYQWIDLETASRLSGISDRHLRRQAALVWVGQGKARTRREAGRKPCYEIRCDAHPSFATVLTPAPQIGASSREFPKGLPEKVRTVILRRRAIIERWEKAIDGGMTMGMTREQATTAFIALLEREAAQSGERAVKRATLFNWQRGWRSDGWMGLSDVRKEKTGKKAAEKENCPFLQAVKEQWLSQNKQKVAAIHTNVLFLARKFGWEPRSYRDTARYIAQFEKDNKALVIKLRKGDEAHMNEAQPFIQRTYETLRSNEIWNADHHQFDVIVKVGEKLDPKTGEMKPILARPWLTAWQDMRSRKIVGQIIRATAPNTDAILQAFETAVITHGVPETIYTDNGKDFDSMALTGETKAMRFARKKVHVEHNQDKLRGVWGAVKCQHIHAWPYHGQSKPIERFFGTLEDRFGRTFDTYCGRNPQEKPEQLQNMLDRGRYPTLQEFVAKFDAWLEADYHNRLHTGESMGDWPSRVWQANLVTMKTCDHEVLRVLCQPRYERKVGQLGVEFQGIWYGKWALNSHLGKTVYIRASRYVATVSVYAEDDTPIAVVESNQVVPANATREQLREVINEEKREAKLVRDAHPAKFRMHQDRTERLIDSAEQASQVEAQKLPPVEAPPTIFQPLRSNLEQHMQTLQELSETPLRRAAGAESMSLQDQLDAFSRSEE